MAGSDDETRLDTTPAKSASGGLQAGTLLNGIYRIEERLGAGGMGEVYRAINLANDEQDAIKIIGHGLAGKTEVEALFRKEARVLAGIHSSAVARLKLFARDPALDLLYFVTEFVPGGSLLDRLRQRPAAPDELRALLVRMLTGLQAVHDAGAVHRDLSPDNIILPGGDVAQAKIIDFGIAKELDPAQTTMIGDRFAGKLGYIAPEQLGFSGARIGPWTDLYSLALVGVAFAAGKPLDMGATVGRAEEARRGPIDLSAVPEDLRAIFVRLLTYDWRERLASGAEAMAMLAGTDVVRPSSPSAVVATSKPRPRRAWLRRVAIIGLVVLITSIVGLAALHWRGQHLPPTRAAPRHAAPPPAEIAGSWMLGAWAVDRAANGCSFKLMIGLSHDGGHLVFTSATGVSQSLAFRTVVNSIPTIETADYRYELASPGRIIGSSRHGQSQRVLEKCDE